MGTWGLHSCTYHIRVPIEPSVKAFVSLVSTLWTRQGHALHKKNRKACVQHFVVQHSMQWEGRGSRYFNCSGGTIWHRLRGLLSWESAI